MPSVNIQNKLFEGKGQGPLIQYFQAIAYYYIHSKYLVQNC